MIFALLSPACLRAECSDNCAEDEFGRRPLRRLQETQLSILCKALQERRNAHSQNRNKLLLEPRMTLEPWNIAR